MPRSGTWPGGGAGSRVWGTTASARGPIRSQEVQQLGPAGPHLAQAALACAGPKDPAEAVVQRRGGFEQHQGLADHGAAGLHVCAEVRFGGEHGAGRQRVVADSLGHPGVHGHPEGRAGLGLHRLLAAS